MHSLMCNNLTTVYSTLELFGKYVLNKLTKAKQRSRSLLLLSHLPVWHWGAYSKGYRPIEVLTHSQGNLEAKGKPRTNNAVLCLILIRNFSFI